jgi:hypothetical protein
MPGRERTRRSRIRKKNKKREIKQDNNKTQQLIRNVQVS